MSIKPVSGKIESQEINDNLSYLDSKIERIDGGPFGSYASLSELNSAYPNGRNGFAVIDGHSYWWKDQNWSQGDIYQSVGIQNKSVTSSKIDDEAVISSHLSRQFRYRGFLNDSNNLNAITEDGIYFFNNSINSPIEGQGVLDINAYYGRWVDQFAHKFGEPFKVYSRRVDADGMIAPTEWETMKDLDSIIKTPYLGISDDVNEVLDNGQYLTINALNSPKYPEVTSWLYDSKVYKTGTNNNMWVVHSAVPSNPSCTYVRMERVIQISGSGSPFFGRWNQLNGKYPKLEHSTIVNFGDSIFGNTQDETSISGYISQFGNCTAHNVGFGGCRMAQHHTSFWDAFSMYRLAYAVTTGDFSVQEQALIDGSGTLPSYFSGHLEILKNLNFNNVDYITIAYGTNDYTGGVLIDNETDFEDTTTFSGALRYTLRLLFERYPHLKVLVISPAYRFWSDESGEFSSDSDTRVFYSNGQALPDFVEAVQEVSKEFKTPWLDQYFELGINKYNRLEYFNASDGTHPIETGRLKMAEKISSSLVSSF